MSCIGPVQNLEENRWPLGHSSPF